MSSESEGSTKSVIVAISTNAGICAAKFTGALLSGSASMLAESFHSLADTGNEILLLVGIKRAAKPADQEHPFGYGKERYFWSFVVAVTLFMLGGAFSVFEGIRKLSSGHDGGEGFIIPLIILGVSALFEGYSFSVAFRNLRSMRHGRTFFRTVLETKDPTVVTVLCEDSAALAGIAIAALGIILTAVTGQPAYDAIGSILIGLLLGTVALFLGSESKGLLIGESASPRYRRQIEQICRQRPEILEVSELLTMQIAPDDILVNLHLRFQPDLTTRQLETAIVGLERDIHQAIPAVNRVFAEPHATDAGAKL